MLVVPWPRECTRRPKRQAKDPVAHDEDWAGRTLLAGSGDDASQDHLHAVTDEKCGDVRQH